MSGYYTVDFIAITPTLVTMIIKVVPHRKYLVRITTTDLKIRMDKSTSSSSKWGLTENFQWIPKYMLRPNKFGKELFNANPQFILKLWELVADKERMKALKGISGNLVVKIPL